MADNTILNPGSGGDTIRTIARGSSKTEVVQLDIGGEGAENLVVGYMPVQDAPAAASLTTIATNTAQGTASTGVTMPSGGAGVLGWLSGIYAKLNGTLTVNTISGFALEYGNLASILAKLNGSIAVTGTFWQSIQPVSGTVTVNTISGFATENGGNLDKISSANGNVADAAWVSGNGSAIALLKASVGALLNPPTTPITSKGTVGTDASLNKPGLPNVGANFATSGNIYANYLYLGVIAASTSRNEVEVVKTSGAQIVLILDDGTAASGAAPANASVFALGGGSGAGSQGGAWQSSIFKGRVQIYAASSSAQVLARTA